MSKKKTVKKKAVAKVLKLKAKPVKKKVPKKPELKVIPKEVKDSIDDDDLRAIHSRHEWVKEKLAMIGEKEHIVDVTYQGGHYSLRLDNDMVITSRKFVFIPGFRIEVNNKAYDDDRPAYRRRDLERQETDYGKSSRDSKS